MGTHLTDAVVRRLPMPAKGYKITYDDEVAGFGCRVTSGGVRSFVYNYRVKTSTRERRPTIGRFPSWATTVARQEARRLEQLVDRGFDPQGDLEDERDAPTMAALLARFDVEHVGARLRAGTQRHYRSLIRKHIVPFFGAHVKVADVSFSDIDALHRKITKVGGPIAANRATAVLSKAFSLAKRWGWRDDSPVHSVERNLEVKRKRYLSGDELAALLKVLATYPDQQVPNVIRLLLLTGARSGEVTSMRWSDLDLSQGTWSKPASTTKQKADHHVALSGPARQLLSELRARGTRAGDWVFPSDTSATGHVAFFEHKWAAICQTAGIRDLHVHDLRHSHASMLASGGANLVVIGAVLGHASPATTSRYVHLFSDVQRAAVEKVGAVIDAAGKGDAKEPVPFPKGGRGGH
jgi:integrase